MAYLRLEVIFKRRNLLGATKNKTVIDSLTVDCPLPEVTYIKEKKAFSHH